MIRLRLNACAGAAVLLLGAWGSDPALGQTQAQTQAQAAPALVLNASAEAAWAEVRAALTPSQQALAVRRFMAALANANGRPVVPPMDAREIASGQAAAADDPALLQRPQAYEATLSVGGRFLTFRPLSRASLEPLTRRGAP
jgi:Mg-chelatase subunit ChlI